MPQNPTAAVLVIGNEILSGRTQDANLNFLAVELGRKGILLREARVVPDVEAEIVAALNALRARYTYVFTTGGIGSTHDDITAASVAKALGRKLVRDEEAARRLGDYYRDRPGGVTDIRLRMANVPEGASLLENPVSGAPGFRVKNVFVLPGVPVIMQEIVRRLLETLPGGLPIVARELSCNLRESLLAERFAAIQERYPQLDLGSYPALRDGEPVTSLVVKGTDATAIAAAAEEVATMIADLGGSRVP